MPRRNKEENVQELNEALLDALTTALEEYKKLQSEKDEKTIRKIKLRQDASRAVLINIMKLIETIELMEMEGLATEELREKIIHAQKQISRDTGEGSGNA